VIDPHEVKWHLMNAACLRKVGNVHQALEKYRETHKKFPEAREVLEYLVRLCTDMKMDREAKVLLKKKSRVALVFQDFAHKLKRLDKTLRERETRETRISSATNKGKSIA
jgi:hypothetical protein